MKLPRERFDYTPLVARRPWKLPKGARIAVWTIVNIEEWDIEQAHGPPVPQRAPGGEHRARRAQLGLARLRDARGLLAPAGGPEPAEDPRHDVHQRPRREVLRAGGARHARRRLGVHGPRRRPGRHAPPARPAGGHPRVHGAPPEVHGPQAQGLARPRAHRDVGDARPPGRGGRGVRVRLGQRRSALRDPHDGGPAGVGPVHPGAERHSHDGDPAPRLRARGWSAPGTSSTASTPRAPGTRG